MRQILFAPAMEINNVGIVRTFVVPAEGDDRCYVIFCAIAAALHRSLASELICQDDNSRHALSPQITGPYCYLCIRPLVHSACIVSWLNGGIPQAALVDLDESVVVMRDGYSSTTRFSNF